MHRRKKAQQKMVSGAEQKSMQTCTSKSRGRVVCLFERVPPCGLGAGIPLVSLARQRPLQAHRIPARASSQPA